MITGGICWVTGPPPLAYSVAGCRGFTSGSRLGSLHTQDFCPQYCHLLSHLRRGLGFLNCLLACYKGCGYSIPFLLHFQELCLELLEHWLCFLVSICLGVARLLLGVSFATSYLFFFLWKWWRGCVCATHIAPWSSPGRASSGRPFFGWHVWGCAWLSTVGAKMLVTLTNLCRRRSQGRCSLRPH